MSEGLTKEQLAAVKRVQARNVATAQELLRMLREQGLEAEAMLAALFTASTSLIEMTCRPEQRLTVLNALLGDTITEWAAEAGRTVTIQ